MSDIEKLEDLKKLVMELVRSKKKFDKLSARRSDMSLDSHTQKAIGNANANLNWHAMEHDKLLREVHAAAVDCGLADPRSESYYSEIEYKPSGFHRYRFKPRVPLCRQ